MGKLWSKNKREGDNELSQKVESFTVGRDYILDQQLIPHDIRASKVHAEGLQRIGLLESDECHRLKQALDELLEQWKNGRFKIRPEDEDGHTAIENFLTEQLGDLGKKIHAGRSRNDQVLTALRLYERSRLEQIWTQAVQLAEEFLDFAEEHRDVPMPGYTHTQRAMLSSVGLWSAAFAERLVMGLEYLSGLYRNVNRCPLGTAAGYGVNIDLPREYVSDRLDFESPLVSSITAQHTRGRMELEILSGLLPLSEVLSQFSNDLIWYTTREFDFFEVADELCTGSSIMPQKKNLDTAEVMRGKHAEIEGAISQLKQVVRNLTTGYHRDLQLTKEPIIKGTDVLSEMLEMGTLMVQHISPKSQNLHDACTPEIFAADKANILVKQGWSFRDAYRRVADNLDKLEEIDINDNLGSRQHLGAAGNPGIELIRKKLDGLELER